MCRDGRAWAVAIGLVVVLRALPAAGQSCCAEQDFEQDLAGSIRLTERTQAGAVVPLAETRRLESSVPAWGSGFGDLAFNARHDFV